MTVAAFNEHDRRFAAIPSKTVTAALTDEPLPEALPDTKKKRPRAERRATFDDTKGPDQDLWRQARDGEELQSLTFRQQVEALCASPLFWSFCREVFPNNNVLTDERGEGAPQHYPDWLLWLIVCAAGTSQTGTINKGAWEFRSAKAWRDFVADVHHHVPLDMTAPADLPARRRRNPVRSITEATTAANEATVAHPQQRRRLARKRTDPATPPPKPHHVDYFIKRFRGLGVKNEPYPPGHRYHGLAAKAQEAFRRVGMEQAHAMGILHPGLRFFYKAPKRIQFIGADGCVFKTAGGGDNDSSDLYRTGARDKDGKPKKARGSKYTIFSARVDGQYHGRVILDFVHTHKDHPGSARGESNAVLAAMPELLRFANGGIRGLLVDSAVRGDAVIALQRDHGVIVNNYCHAESNPGGHEKRLHPDRIEKSKLRFVATHTNSLGVACEHPIFANGGEFVELVMTADGTDTVRALKILDYEVRRSGGIYRERLELQIPDCPFGDPFTVKVPLFHDNPVSNAPRGEIWGEVVRVYPPGSWQFKYLYGARNDTEARHSDLKMRARHLPADVPGQLLRLLAASMTTNAAGYQVHLQAHGKPNVLDDTA